MAQTDNDEIWFDVRHVKDLPKARAEIRTAGAVAIAWTLIAVMIAGGVIYALS